MYYNAKYWPWLPQGRGDPYGIQVLLGNLAPLAAGQEEPGCGEEEQELARKKDEGIGDHSSSSGRSNTAQTSGKRRGAAL